MCIRSGNGTGCRLVSFVTLRASFRYSSFSPSTCFLFLIGMPHPFLFFEPLFAPAVRNGQCVNQRPTLSTCLTFGVVRSHSFTFVHIRWRSFQCQQNQQPSSMTQIKDVMESSLGKWGVPILKFVELVSHLLVSSCCSSLQSLRKPRPFSRCFHARTPLSQSKWSRPNVVVVVFPPVVDSKVVSGK